MERGLNSTRVLIFPVAITQSRIAMPIERMVAANKRVNTDAYFVRIAHKICAGYAWRYEFQVKIE
ncbi:MAG: hypothetical protein CMN81_11830 [Spongiibacter sp.]|nr:hypothetical protein [Spongiibacter sp.]